MARPAGGQEAEGVRRAKGLSMDAGAGKKSLRARNEYGVPGILYMSNVKG